MGFNERRRRQGMKTSLKKLGHFSEVFCGKGFWGHVVCNVMFIHLHECVWNIDITNNGRVYKPTPHPHPTFHSIPLSSGHTSKQPTIRLMWHGHSQSKTSAHHYFPTFPTERLLFFTKKEQVCIHSHISPFQIILVNRLWHKSKSIIISLQQWYLV